MSVVSKVIVVFSTFSLAALLAPAALGSPTAGERALLTEMNRVRAAHGAPALRVDVRLQQAARFHSRDMLRRGYFAHGEFARRMASFGARGPRVGENLGWGVGPSGSAQAIVYAWLASPLHRENLLRSGFRRVGVGRLTGMFAGYGGAAIVTADFAGR